MLASIPRVGATQTRHKRRRFRLGSSAPCGGWCLVVLSCSGTDPHGILSAAPQGASAAAVDGGGGQASDASASDRDGGREASRSEAGRTDAPDADDGPRNDGSPTDGPPAEEASVDSSAADGAPVDATSPPPSDDGHALVPLSRWGWTASASVSAPADPPSNAIDGNQATRWTPAITQTVGQWFEIDLAAPQSFTTITIDAGFQVDDYPRAFEVLVSNDGSTWSAPIAAGTGSSSLVTIAVTPQSARFVRILLTSAASQWWSIAELDLWD